MYRPTVIRTNRGNGRPNRSTIFAVLAFFFLSAPASFRDGLLVSASTAVAPPATAAGSASSSTASSSAAIVAESASSGGASGNPVLQLFGYVKTSCTNFKDGMVQMNTDHRRCNGIRAKQRAFAIAGGGTRPRGARGIQTGGIDYEEYDFLRKGLVDRNKLFATAVVSVCLPNYFVYYLWSFPDMMPGPFTKGGDEREISRERCHAVMSTLLEIEKGARVAPWTAKLNPFGRKATERAMAKLGDFVALGVAGLEEHGANASDGGRMMLERLRPRLYSSEPPTKRERLLAGNVLPKQLAKGLARAIGADPLNKGSSPFGVGAVKHIELVTLADEFLVDQGVDLDSVGSALLSEACSARLIGGPGRSDEERREGLASWLREAEVKPREATGDGELHYNGNLARAALMCYNAVDGTRDRRADSGLARAMYQGQTSLPSP